MSFFTTAILLGFLTAGSLFLRQNKSRAEEIFRFASGRIEQVTVANGKNYYCPYSCRVNHRHIVHEVEWHCDDSDNCVHFVITYGLPGKDNNIAARPPLADGGEATGTLAEMPPPNR